MTGVILCGGQSARMGTDKGLLSLQDRTWAQTAMEKMIGLALPVVFSVNEQQFNNYAAIFPVNQLIKDNPVLDTRGPLRGVLSIHLQYPAEDLFVLACDMPLMETAVLKQLQAQFEKHAADAYVFTNDEAFEPLCAIYTAKGLSRILELQKNKQLLKHSMKYVLEQLHPVSIALTMDQKKYFRNFNAHAELNGL